MEPQIARPGRFAAVLLFCLAFITGNAGAEEIVSEQLPSGTTVTASLQGSPESKTAALVLHGFLQTREFPTVTGVGEALAGAGYAVLTPTLSLGVPARKSSLPCEAIHLHTFDSDVAEVAFWIRWLTARGYERIVLVGHSFGSVQLLAYLARKPAPQVRRAVMISLADVENRQNATARAKLARDLNERLNRKAPALVGMPFSHCRKYVSTPAALLSYVSVTRNLLLGWLDKVRVPVEVIMGGADDRMGQGWVDLLTLHSSSVRVIAGANHFFDNQFEFDLQDAVVRAAGSVTPR